MQMDGGEHSLREAVDSWLETAAANLCDAAKAELRGRLCVSTRERMQELAADGMPAEEALRQAVVELGDPSDSRAALEAKHLTKREFIQVAQFLTPDTKPQRIDWRSMLGVLGLPLFLAPLLILLLGEPEAAFVAFIGVFFAILVSIGAPLVVVIMQPGQFGAMRRGGPFLSRTLWRYGRRQAISDFSLGLLILLSQLIGESRDSVYNTSIYLVLSCTLFISSFSSIFLKKKLLRKVESLEADGFQYIVPPQLLSSSQEVQPRH